MFEWSSSNLSLCNFSHPVHSHEIRFSRNNLVMPKCHILCTGQCAVNYKGVMAWNGLNIGTKQSHSLTSFKSNLVKDILARQMYVKPALEMQDKWSDFIILTWTYFLKTFKSISCLVVLSRVFCKDSVCSMSGPLWKSILTVRASWWNKRFLTLTLTLGGYGELNNINWHVVDA